MDNIRDLYFSFPGPNVILTFDRGRMTFNFLVI